MMMTLKNIFCTVVVIFLLAACSDKPEPATIMPNTAVPPTAVPSQPAATATTMPTVSAVGTAVPSQPISPPTWPAPPAPYDALSRAPITEAEQTARQQLETGYPPDRDDIALFAAYQGIAAVATEPPLVANPLKVGTTQEITINNTDLNTNDTPEFILKYVSDHAYFWFDTTPGLNEPSAAELKAMGDGFDEIYERDRLFFGSEDNPGVDGDPRVHIVNSSPLNLCDIGADELDFCGLLGYFSSDNLIPQLLNPASNAREMFVMNGRYFGQFGYLDTLAHEFRHMIEENHDVNDWDWEVEGSAMLAEELVGFPGDGAARGNLFLEEPDQQLNRWTDGDPTAHYGQGYLLNRYIFNRLGPDLYYQFATHPDPAFAALDAIAAENDLDFDSGQEIWLDWLVALAIHNQPDAPEMYALNEEVDTAVTHPLRTTTETTVSQYAADYYELDSKGQITFTGSNHVPLLPVQPTSGSHMWLANRANYSASRLTRLIDLTAVDSATLEYDIYHDIEAGYDFAYLTVSTDGGQSWQPLAGKQMQGNHPEDDPSDSSLTDHFYTGQSDNWVHEVIDLTPYAGRELLLRFEYITDPILTFGGLALDNISIPEIALYDDAETDTNWQAEGFVRSTGYVPQQWHLRLITFTDDGPVVETIAVDGENTAVIPLPTTSSRPPILIIAATAPMTLQPAYYQLTSPGS